MIFTDDFTEEPALPIGASPFGPPTDQPAQPIAASPFGPPTNQPALPIGGQPTEPPAIPLMSSTFKPAFVGLSGIGSLSTIQATIADAGTVLQGVVNDELKSYRVRSGTDEEAHPGIVHPANFDADENPVVFVMI
ncbi:hypothetical protein OPIT5_08345 [Opitutaceae bacterium TAV5]|nr:hypothetical protein OPIT5_08345 [Opitutaceae bacterium TAV5]